LTASEQAGSNVSIALVHYPVFDKNRQVVATAITNLDLHDIARAARTFGLFRYYVVTPVAEQREMAERIGRHWREGWGATYNTKRKAALEMMTVVESLKDALGEIEQTFGKPAKVVATGAHERLGSISAPELAGMLRDRSQPYLILLGTGWGLTDEVFASAQFVLAPIRGASEYNHLSVRSAAAILLDRLLGER
jgi:hypothetical protein